MFRRRGRAAWAAAAVLAAVLLVRAEVVEPVRVGSDSMAPTLRRGEHVLLDKLGAVRRGDLVAFRSPQDGELTLKRAVAVAGQTVEIRDALLYVDGRLVHEPGIDADRIDGTYFGPVTVGPGQVFVLGDNRARSVDSRVYGGVPLDAVVGRAVR